METTHPAGMEQARKGGLLYPMLVIAAIAVIVFSVVGVATMLGWMPKALSEGESTAHGVAPGAPPAAAEPARPATSAARPATSSAPQPVAVPPRVVASAPVTCADCGVIESIRT